MYDILMAILGPAITFLSALVVNLIRGANISDKIMVGVIVPALAIVVAAVEQWVGGLSGLPFYVMVLANLAATFFHQVWVKLKG